MIENGAHVNRFANLKATEILNQAESNWQCRKRKGEPLARLASDDC